jgi:hypothetical protein
MEAHELERENVLRLTDKDASNTLAVLKDINDGLDFATVQLNVSAERKIKKSPVGKTTNPLPQHVEHLGAKRFQDEDSNKLPPVSQSGRNDGNDNLSNS